MIKLNSMFPYCHHSHCHLVGILGLGMWDSTDMVGFLRILLLLLLCHTHATLAGFWNGVKWKLLVKYRIPKIAILRGYHFVVHQSLAIVHCRYLSLKYYTIYWITTWYKPFWHVAMDLILSSSLYGLSPSHANTYLKINNVKIIMLKTVIIYNFSSHFHSTGLLTRWVYKLQCPSVFVCVYLILQWLLGNSNSPQVWVTDRCQ